MATWEAAGQARRAFADMIESLSEEQLAQPTLCDAWTPKGVLAHLTGFVETGFFGFFAAMIGGGFNFDKVSINLADKQLARPTPDVLTSLRSKATKSAPMPTFPEDMTLADVLIHTQDVRRPLGLDGQPDPDLLRRALDFLTTHKLATMLVERPDVDGVRLVATDLEWSHGTGPEITGTGEAIMMALANRPVRSELSGDGLAAWD